MLLLLNPVEQHFRFLTIWAQLKIPYLTAILYHPLNHVAVASVCSPVQSCTASQVSSLPGSTVSSEILYNIQVSCIASKHQTATYGRGGISCKYGRHAQVHTLHYLAQTKKLSFAWKSHENYPWTYKMLCVHQLTNGQAKCGISMQWNIIQP